jgi:heme-degrading monooxygenase HmoA
MIVRMWRGRTRAERADEYFEYLKRTGVREYEATRGHRGVRVLRRVERGEAEFLVLSLWDSLDAIRRFAGEEFEKPVYYPEDEKFLLELEPRVSHYAVILEEGKRPEDLGFMIPDV